ncbi:hypothetical protein GCM10009558_016470 [Virgisporangium aurantiacum]
MTRHRSRRPVLVVLSVILALILLGGAGALVAVFLASDPDKGNGPTTAESKPGTISLTLDDKGNAVALTWTDPSSGQASFVVSYGRADGPADKTQRVGAGTTTVTIGQLDPSQDYCFTIAGEPGSGVGPSPAICTKRPAPGAGSTSPRPSGT